MKIKMGKKIIVVIAFFGIAAINASNTTATKSSLLDRFKTSASKVGTSIKSGAKSFGSGAKKVVKSEHFKEAFSTGLGLADKLGTAALENKHRQDELRAQQAHDRQILIEQQKHELEMKRLEVEIARLKMQEQTEANNAELQKLQMQLNHEKELAGYGAQQ